MAYFLTKRNTALERTFTGKAEKTTAQSCWGLAEMLWEIQDWKNRGKAEGTRTRIAGNAGNPSTAKCTNTMSAAQGLEAPLPQRYSSCHVCKVENTHSYIGDGTWQDTPAGNTSQVHRHLCISANQWKTRLQVQWT